MNGVLEKYGQLSSSSSSVLSSSRKQKANLLIKTHLWSHQKEAVELYKKTAEDFLCHHFCGTGKSRIMLEVLCNAKKKALFVFPSQALIEQFEEKYVAKYLETNKRYTTVYDGNGYQDLRSDVVLTTYQSMHHVVESNVKFECVCFDEAHHLKDDNDWCKTAEQLKVGKRLYFTATPTPEQRELPSHRYTHVEAVKNGHNKPFDLIVDVYQKDKKDFLKGRVHSIVRAVKKYGVRRIIVCCRFSNDVAGDTGLSSVAAFAAYEAEMAKALIECGVESDMFFPLTADTTAEDRQAAFSKFADEESDAVRVILNCQVLREGVDLPNADMVVFMDPKHSPVAVIQTLGRITRLGGLERGYVLIPCAVDAGDYKDEDTVEGRTKVVAGACSKKSGDFSSVVMFAAALKDAEADFGDGLIEGMMWPGGKGKKDCPDGGGGGGGGEKRHRVHFDFEGVSLALALKGAISEAVQSCVVEMAINRGAEFPPFEEAHKIAIAFCKKNGIGTKVKWSALGKKKRPRNLPSNPDAVYKDKGYISWPHWLTGVDNRVEYPPFEEAHALAIAFCKKNGIDTSEKWRKLGKKKRPRNLPTAPWETYKGKGYISWSHWRTGVDNRVEFPPFEKAHALAIAFCKKNGIDTSTKWRKMKPHNLPVTPWQVYKNRGWVDWPHWLGTDKKISKSSKKKKPARKKKKTSGSSTKTTTDDDAFLDDLDVTADDLELSDAASYLQGTYMAITGVLPSLERRQCMALIERHGGRVRGAVSDKTTHLIAGDILEDGREVTESAKYRKAVQKKCIIINEKSLLDMIAEKKVLARLNKAQSDRKRKQPPVAEASLPDDVGTLQEEVRRLRKRLKRNTEYGESHDEDHKQWKVRMNDVFGSSLSEERKKVLVLDDDAHPAFGTSRRLCENHGVRPEDLVIVQYDAAKASRMKQDETFGDQVVCADVKEYLAGVDATTFSGMYLDFCGQFSAMVAPALRAVEKWPPGMVIGLTWSMREITAKTVTYNVGGLSSLLQRTFDMLTIEKKDGMCTCFIRTL